MSSNQLNLCILMDSSFWFYTINLGQSIVHIKGCPVIIKKIYSFVKRSFFFFTNSVEPDEMQQNAAFHLGLHCLQKYWYRGFLSTKPIYVHQREITEMSGLF